MNTSMRAIVGVFLVVSILEGSVHAEGTEGIGNEPIRRVADLSADLKAVADLPSRVYWREINGDFQCTYKADAKAANDAIGAFARAGGKEIVLWPGTGRYETFEGKVGSCDFALHVPGGIGLFMLKSARTEAGTPIFEVEPTLTIYVSDAIPADRLTIPKSLAIREIRDLRDRFVAGLRGPKTGAVAEAKTDAERHERTTAATVRAQCAYQLGMLGPIADDVVEPLRQGLKDPEMYVRLCAIDALARLGAPAARAIPDLEIVSKEAKDDREKQAATKAVSALKSAKAEPATGLKERIEAIHRIKAGRS
ncbi:MAG: hypothetical protein JWN86_4037 [Planctomycetota bacterium]|nr:hypothetical protein [Planctomycetota bacterium]